MIRLCFVCTGNICRSPTAEGVMRSLVEEAGLEHLITVDSAGTVGWKSGAAPDPRSAAAARARGVDLEGRARALRPDDMATSDYLLAMDRGHVADLTAMAWEPAQKRKIHLLRAFDPRAPSGAEVPDPYSGGPGGFDKVYDMCLAACRGLLEHLREQHGLP